MIKSKGLTIIDPNARYWELFWKNRVNTETDINAYEMTEDQYIVETGSMLYSSYQSFKVGKFKRYTQNRKSIKQWRKKYWELYYEYCSTCESYQDAYNRVEQLYRNETGKIFFKSYDSFRMAKSRRINR